MFSTSRVCQETRKWRKNENSNERSEDSAYRLKHETYCSSGKADRRTGARLCTGLFTLMRTCTRPVHLFLETDFESNFLDHSNFSNFLEAGLFCHSHDREFFDASRHQNGRQHQELLLPLKKTLDWIMSHCLLMPFIYVSVDAANWFERLCIWSNSEIFPIHHEIL